MNTTQLCPLSDKERRDLSEQKRKNLFPVRTFPRLFPAFLWFLVARALLYSGRRAGFGARVWYRRALGLPFYSARFVLAGAFLLLLAARLTVEAANGALRISRRLSRRNTRRPGVIFLPVMGALLFLTGCLADPGDIGKFPQERFSLGFTPRFGISREINKEIKEKITKIAGGSSYLDCAFENFDIGLWSALLSRQENVSAAIDPAAEALAEALDARRARLAFDRDEKCKNELSFYLLYRDKLDLLFKEPDRRKRAQNAKLLYGDCKAKTLPEIYAEMEPSRGDRLKNAMSFVNITGSMRNTFCLADRDIHIWPALSPDALASPGALLEIKAAPEELLQKLKRELDGYARNLSGNIKKERRPARADFMGLEISFFTGPEDKPLQVLSEYSARAVSLDYYTSGLEINSAAQELTQTLENLASNGRRVRGYHGFNKAWASGSFFLHMTALLQGAFEGKGGFEAARFLPVKNAPSDFHFFFIETSSETLMLFYNGCLSYSCQTYDDSLLVVLKTGKAGSFPPGAFPFDAARDFFSEFEKNRVTPQSAPAAAGDVAVTEIVWMGSLEDGGMHPSDEMIELYNRQNANINIGGWKIACTSDITGQTADMVLTLPPGLTIGPGKYLTLSASRNYAFEKSDVEIPGLRLLNATRECLLVDPSGDSPFWPQAATGGHYNDPALQGAIIDRVLDYRGAPFNRDASHHYSPAGVSRQEGVWSMERISPDSDGSLPESWQSHYGEYTPASGPDYLFTTHHSGGAPSPARPLHDILPGEIIISEINWMGSYDDLGTSHPSDEYVEFYNTSGRDIEIGRLLFGCTSDSLFLTGSLLFSFAPGANIPAGGFLTVYRRPAAAYDTSRAGTLEESFTLNNTIRQCLLKGPGPGAVHYGIPLFTGIVIDSVSDGSAPFDALTIGINNTTLKKRQSGERLSPRLPGDVPANWGPSTGFFSIAPGYRSSTRGTPGEKNSLW